MLESGHKPLKGGVDIEMGEGVATFSLLYSSIIFTLCVCGGSKVPFVTFQIFICTFLIHYGSAQKKLTASFNFGCNTQKKKGQFFLSAQARSFLVLKRF